MHQNIKMRNDWYVISTASIKNKVTFSQFMFIRNSITNSWADVNSRRKTLEVLVEKQYFYLLLHSGPVYTEHTHYFTHTHKV